MSHASNLHAPALEPADLVVFGGTGDLALRKIVPALYYRLQAGQFDVASRIFLVSRQPIDAAAHRALLHKTCREFVAPTAFNEADFERLIERTHHLAIDALVDGDYLALVNALSKKPHVVRVFYLATPPDLFGPICVALRSHGLVTADSRVVLEKPIGRDLASFDAINNAVLECFSEEQVYRIDHYLGKETVQNLMVLRFGNAVFERLWNDDAIEHVQITVAESIGVGERFSYYDHYGALRDMVQNHLLQLVCLVAMEPPAFMKADTVRDEKLKVLRALRPITAETAASCSVRGQYTEGMMGGKKVDSYIADIHGKKSDTETFVALKVFIDNWRWSGIPFYLRTGKRLPERYSEIVIQFRRPVLHHMFPQQADLPENNRLIIRLQPDEHVSLQMNTKIPGPGGYRLKPVNLKLSLAEEFTERAPDAYERLLMDVVRGNPLLFMRTDEVDAAWRWTETILQAWEETGSKAEPYPSGSWGPDSAAALVANDGQRWHSADESPSQ